MLTANNFTYGLLTPALSYGLSCMGSFLGLRCASRAMASAGHVRLRWLLLSALSIGAIGVWVTHFIAMLGYTIPGQAIRYSVGLTVAGMLVAVAVVSGGLLIAGFAARTWRNLVEAGVFTGAGLAGMLYIGIAAVRTQARISYDAAEIVLSVSIAILAAIAVLWATRVRGRLATLGAALVVGAAMSAVHYAAMAAIQPYPPGPGAGLAATGGGATAESFLLPLIVGITIVAFVVTATLILSPTEQEMRAETDLMQRIQVAGAELAPPAAPVAAPRPVRWPALAAGRVGAHVSARTQGMV